NVCSVRLVQQDGEFAEHSARLRHPGDFNIFLDDYYVVLVGRSPRLYAPKGGELPIAIDMDKTGITNTQQYLHFLDCLCDHAERRAALKLLLQLNEYLIGATYPTCKDRRNVKGSVRILREKGRRIAIVPYTTLFRSNVCSVRLVQQDGEFAEHSARLRHPGDF